MKIKSLFVILLLAALYIPQYSAASDAEKRTAANELFDAMNMNVMLDQSIEGMLQMQIRSNPQLGVYEKIMRDFLKKYMSGESLRTEFVEIYNDAFTEKELLDIVSFYHTSTGRKSLQQTPSLMQKFAMIGQKRVQDNSVELQKLIADETARLKKSSESSAKQ